MKIVVAPQAFKGTLGAADVCRAIEAGIRDVEPDASVVRLPVADGGDGFLEALVTATSGVFFDAWVTGPLGVPVAARWGALGDGVTAVIELATASGLRLLDQEQRDPTVTTSRGAGELMIEALERGFGRLIVGTGGSATNDGGAGLLQALGVKLCDRRGRDIEPGGLALAGIRSIDESGIDRRLSRATIVAAVDVDNPLLGPDGATFVYGPQKGATPEQLTRLEKAMTNLANVVQCESGKDMRRISGGGSAGGAGAALWAFLRVELRPGIEIVLDLVGFDRSLAGADLVITGEGRWDRQTEFGKAPAGVLDRASEHGVPVALVAGSLGEGMSEDRPGGFAGVAVAAEASRIASMDDVRRAARAVVPKVLPGQ